MSDSQNQFSLESVLDVKPRRIANSSYFEYFVDSNNYNLAQVEKSQKLKLKSQTSPEKIVSDNSEMTGTDQLVAFVIAVGMFALAYYSISNPDLLEGASIRGRRAFWKMIISIFWGWPLGLVSGGFGSAILLGLLINKKKA